MKQMSLKEFKNVNNMEMIKELMKFNNGYVTSKQITDLGIHRMYLKMLKEKNIIEKIAPGIYIDSSKIEDNYYLLNVEISKIIYSHMTALYFHGLSIKAPDNIFDITVNYSYNNPKLKNHNVFYVNNDIYNLGLTEVKTPMGNIVKAYDMERCICDIIRSINRMDLEYVKYSVKKYLQRKDKNITKLTQYAEKMGIKDKVINFISMIYE